MIWFEVRGYPAAAQLLPPEEPLVADASPKRLREFTAGRYCARKALAQLGIAAAPILAGDRGEPLWPAGVVGSITHCTGYTAAAVAWAEDVPTIGIDAEPNEPLPAGVLETISLPVERPQLRDRPNWDRLLFSAKEAVFKAWYPLTHRLLHFEDVAVVIDPDNTFATNFNDFAGRWTVVDGFILTMATLN